MIGTTKLTHRYKPKPFDQANIDLAERVVLNAPIGSSSQTPLVEWDQFLDYTGYFVTISTDENHTNIVEESFATGTSYQVQSQLASGVQHYVKVTVAWGDVEVDAPDPVEGIESVTVSGTATLRQNGTRQLSATVNGTGDFDSSVTWSSMNTSLATVDQNGLVTYVNGSIGTTVIITATATDGTSGSITLEIIEQLSLLDNRFGDEQFLELFAGTTDVGWTTFSLDNPPTGVSVADVDGELRITEFDVFEQGISGNLPNNIGNLTKCEYLNVKMNALTGNIPESIWNLQSCEMLLLSGAGRKTPYTNPLYDTHQSKSDESGNLFNDFPSPPSSGNNLNALKQIQFSGTASTQYLPEELFNCPNLEAIHASWNPSWAFELPSYIGNASNLIWLYHRSCALTGSIPNSIENLSGTLKHIHFGNGNSMSGNTLPDFSQFSLRNFNLDGNDFTAEWPSYWNNGNFTGMISLRATWNNFTGTLHGLNNLPNLSSFDLVGNDIEGSLDSSISNCTNLKILGLGWTNMSGQVPSLAALPVLRTVYLNSAGFSGKLPEMGVDSNSNLNLHFDNCNYEGAIPESWVPLNVGSFNILSLADNILSGPIPSGLASIGTEVNISGNKYCQEDLDTFQALLTNGTTLNASDQDQTDCA